MIFCTNGHPHVQQCIVGICVKLEIVAQLKRTSCRCLSQGSLVQVEDQGQVRGHLSVHFLEPHWWHQHSALLLCTQHFFMFFPVLMPSNLIHKWLPTKIPQLGQIIPPLKKRQNEFNRQKAKHNSVLQIIWVWMNFSFFFMWEHSSSVFHLI